MRRELQIVKVLRAGFQIIAVLLTVTMISCVIFYLMMMALRGGAWENLVVWAVIAFAVMGCWSFGLFKKTA